MSQQRSAVRPSTDARRVLLLALLVAFGLQWKSCIEPNRIHEGWREHAHWIVPSAQAFQPDDRLIRFQEFLSSPVGDAVYTTLSRTGFDVAWGKLNGIVWFALATLLLFGAARALEPGRLAGWAAALTFALFPSKMPAFVGGLMPGLSLLILCATVYVLVTGRWWWSIPLILLQGGVDWNAAPQLALLVVLLEGRRRPVAALLAVLACAVVVVPGAGGSSSEFGEIVDRVDMRGQSGFAAASPLEFLPVPSMASAVWTHLGSWSFLATAVAAFLILGRRMFALPRSLYALLIASVAMFGVADVLLMRLGDPAAFVARGVSVCAALATGVWVSRMMNRERAPRQIVATPMFDLRASTAALAIAGFVAVGLLQHRATYLPVGDAETRYFGPRGLYAVIELLPQQIMLASHPRTASDLPLMTGRSVVVSADLADPRWPGQWEWTVERIQDVLRAYFSADPEVVLQVTRKYDIDFWVVDLARYDPKTRARGAMFHEPFVSFAHRYLADPAPSVLRAMPAPYRVWTDGKAFSLVSADDVERYAADERAGRVESEP